MKNPSNLVIDYRILNFRPADVIRLGVLRWLYFTVFKYYNCDQENTLLSKELLVNILYSSLFPCALIDNFVVSLIKKKKRLSALLLALANDEDGSDSVLVLHITLCGLK